MLSSQDSARQRDEVLLDASNPPSKHERTPLQWALDFGLVRCQNRLDAGLRLDDFYGGLSAISDSAAHRQVHPALVWRRARRMDGLPALFSGVPAGWICLR